MRGTPARVLGAVALGAVVAATAACGPFGSADKTAACKAMKSELEGIASKVKSENNPTAAGQVYSNAATEIRSQGGKAGGDVEPAANKVATDLDAIADALHEADSDNIEIPNTSSLIRDGAKLQTACNA